MMMAILDKMTSHTIPDSLSPLLGFEDKTGRRAEAFRYLGAKLTEFFSRYGFKEIETPVIERPSTWDHPGVLPQIGPKAQFEDYFLEVRTYDVDNPVLSDNDPRKYVNVSTELAILRPEGTNAVCRHLAGAKFGGTYERPLKVFYISPMFRNDAKSKFADRTKPRGRMFYQAGVELMDSSDLLADAEICDILKGGIDYVGFKGESVLRVSDIGLFEGVVDLFVNTLAETTPYFHDLNTNGSMVRSDLKGKIDQISSARAEANPAKEKAARQSFERYLGQFKTLRPEWHSALDTVTETFGGLEELERASKALSKLDNPKINRAVENLRILATYFDALELPHKFDLALVRGLDIYTGPVQQLDLIYPDGRRVVEAAGGGRYDNDVGNFLRRVGIDEDVPSTGFAYGLDRLVQAMFDTDSLPPRSDAVTLFLDDKNADVLVFSPDKVKALKEARRLRKQGVRVEVDLSGRSKDELTDYTNRKGIKFEEV
ncbi:MAG TPA: ATP phosphoribosyltransferase regulatory subunit [Candidatus Wunengus californicus]|uniref:ATP phosphoribosyltransferase regulatory subunit n=1 Tax=Candidatus Wunengus californicus TaxID=3367619 RepID=UPI0040276AEF